jgi:uncharacterized protein (DUF427 family)
MPELIPNKIYKRAAEICDLFPTVDFLTIAGIIHASSSDVQTVESLPVPQDARKKKVLKRKQKVRIVIDGKVFASPNRRSLLKELSMSDHYIDLFHNKKSGIPEEAERIARAIKEKNGKSVTDYYSYSFDGKFYHATLDAGRVTNCQEVKA